MGERSPCAQCGGPIPSHKYSSAIYCSGGCQYEARKERKRLPPESIECKKCGGPIPSTRRSDAAYCGKRCRWAAEKLRHRRREEGPRRCPICHTEVFWKTYCSKPCYLVHRRAEAKAAYRREVYGDPTITPENMSKDPYKRAKAKGFRSGLEVQIAEQLKGIGQPFDYEPFRVPYVQPEKQRRFVPDFVLTNGIIIEAKGRWETKDRQKFLMIKDSWPDLDIRFVFSRSASTISKRSKTTYADYCRTNGWQYADKEIPLSWIRAPKNTDSIAAIREILKDRINQK